MAIFVNQLFQPPGGPKQLLAGEYQLKSNKNIKYKNNIKHSP